MIHTSEGKPLSQAEVEYIRATVWGILKGVKERSGKPFMSGTELPVNERSALTAEASQNLIDGIASKYGVFFLEHSEIQVQTIPNKPTIESK